MPAIGWRLLETVAQVQRRPDFHRGLILAVAAGFSTSVRAALIRPPAGWYMQSFGLSDNPKG